MKTKRSIPKKEKNETNVKPSVIKKQTPLSKQEGITFSFEALEKTEYFNLDSTCENWSSDLFEMLKDISSIRKESLIAGEYGIYRIHNHEKAKPPSNLPEGVELKDFYQIRISKSKGGIHGVFNENVFYIIWLDPHHNMYPDPKYGGLKKIKPPLSCCKDRENIILELFEANKNLKKENEDLKEENKYWEEEINKLK